MCCGPERPRVTGFAARRDTTRFLRPHATRVRRLCPVGRHPRRTGGHLSAADHGHELAGTGQGRGGMRGCAAGFPHDQRSQRGSACHARCGRTQLRSRAFVRCVFDRLSVASLAPVHPSSPSPGHGQRRRCVVRNRSCGGDRLLACHRPGSVCRTPRSGVCQARKLNHTLRAAGARWTCAASFRAAVTPPRLAGTVPASIR